MATYYAVCNVNGPISRKIEAESHEAAIAQFEAADSQKWIDNADTDAEDDLDISGADMDESEFSDAIESAGCVLVRDLAVVQMGDRAPAHLSGGWELWVGK